MKKLTFALLALAMMFICVSTAFSSTQLSVTETIAVENPTADWLFWDDFDEDRLHNYFEYTRPAKFYRNDGDGLAGSTAMRCDFAMGDVAAGDLKLSFGRTPNNNYHKPVAALGEDLTEMYVRYYVRYDDDWTGGGAAKMSRITSLHQNWAQSMIAHTWSTGGSVPNDVYLGLDPATGIDINKAIPGSGSNLVTTKYNDFNNLQWLGIKQSNTPIFNSAHVGQWYAVEIHVKLNDPGLSNGVFELWIDDVLEASSYDLNWIGSYEMGVGKGYGLNTFMLENYWNDGSPKAQSRYFDNLVVSRSKIGLVDLVDIYDIEGSSVKNGDQ